ncbi:MAG: ankyrin repeat domain-containing protein [Methylomonas sp.]|nr:ankyrin repeat domain-containing protein [Methylomonas sp.]
MNAKAPFCGYSRAVLSAVFAFFVTLQAAVAADPVEARKNLQQMGIEYTEQQFAKSAGEGDMIAVELFLDAGMDSNAGGGAALGLAAGRGRLEMVKLLLAKGAKPTANSLQYARTRGHKEIEKILVEAGAKE